MPGNSVLFFAAGHVSTARGIEALWPLFVQPPMVLVKNSYAERSGCGQQSFLSSFPILKLLCQPKLFVLDTDIILERSARSEQLGQCCVFSSHSVLQLTI